MMFYGCQDPNTELGGRHVSDNLEFGNGSVSFWIEQDASDRPLNFGFIGDEILLDDPVDERLELTLPLPDEVEPFAPYQLFRIYYLPEGHSPDGLNVPQFKLRAYLIDEQEYEELQDADEEVRKTTPSSQYLPEGYELLERGGNPPVGSQWLSPNINNNVEDDFLYAFAYGFNDGELVYLETMISREALIQNPEAQLELDLPDAYQREGFYPRANFISYTRDSDEFFISKDQLIFNPAN